MGPHPDRRIAGPVDRRTAARLPYARMAESPGPREWSCGMRRSAPGDAVLPRPGAPRSPGARSPPAHPAVAAPGGRGFRFQ